MIHIKCSSQPGRSMAMVLLSVILASTLMTTASAGTEPLPPLAKDTKPASAAATAFLRGRCDPIQLPTYCYETLLPHAESFDGNDVKLARTATAVFDIHLRSSLSEMRHSNRTTPNTNTAECIKLIQEATRGDKEALASFARVDAAAGQTVATQDLEDVKKWIQKATYKVGQCDQILSDDTPPLPFTVAHMSQSLFLAINLLKAIGVEVEL